MIRCMWSILVLLATVLTDISDRNESEDEDTVIATRQKQSEGPLAKMILIRVGDAQDSQTIPVLRKFLCKKSHYFKDAFKDDPERSSFEFPEQEPEIFERAMNWIYGEGFLLRKDTAESDDADWLSTQASREAQATNEAVSLLVVEHGSGYRQAVSPVPSTRFIDSVTGSDFSDGEQETHAPGDASAEIEAPTPLDTMMLSKLYALAEFLKMDKLCKELIELLCKRLGYDEKTPNQALIYAFKRCAADSLLRKLLIDFTARSAPILDASQDSTFDATTDLWPALVKELTGVRGADVLRGGDWTEHFEATL
ncbi:hypothetical protein MBLNU13_g11334t1 [Cladosporium sp. NU13]